MSFNVQNTTLDHTLTEIDSLSSQIDSAKTLEWYLGSQLQRWKSLSKVPLTRQCKCTAMHLSTTTNGTGTLKKTSNSRTSLWSLARKTGSESPAFFKIAPMCSVCIAGKRFSIHQWLKDHGQLKKIRNSRKMLLSMERRTGVKLPKHFLVESESNAEKGGTTTWTPT